MGLPTEYFTTKRYNHFAVNCKVIMTEQVQLYYCTRPSTATAAGTVNLLCLTVFILAAANSEHNSAHILYSEAIPYI